MHCRKTSRRKIAMYFIGEQNYLRKYVCRQSCNLSGNMSQLQFWTYQNTQLEGLADAVHSGHVKTTTSRKSTRQPETPWGRTRCQPQPECVTSITRATMVSGRVWPSPFVYLLLGPSNSLFCRVYINTAAKWLTPSLRKKRINREQVSDYSLLP